MHGKFNGDYGSTAASGEPKKHRYFHKHSHSVEQPPTYQVKVMIDAEKEASERKLRSDQELIQAL